MQEIDHTPGEPFYIAGEFVVERMRDECYTVRRVRGDGYQGIRSDARAYERELSRKLYIEQQSRSVALPILAFQVAGVCQCTYNEKQRMHKLATACIIPVCV